jgi:hypothetical protein
VNATDHQIDGSAIEVAAHSVQLLTAIVSATSRTLTETVATSGVDRAAVSDTASTVAAAGE